MKKTILAIAIPALFASAANATVIYDKDGTSFDVFGRVHAQYSSEYDAFAIDDNGDEAKTKTDDSLTTYTRLGWTGKTALNNTWSVLGRAEWELSSEKSGNDSLTSRHVYAGFDGSQYGQFLFGQTDTPFYLLSVAKTDIFEDYGDVANGYDGRQEGQLQYRGKWGGLSAQAAYITTNTGYSEDTGWTGGWNRLANTDEVEGRLDDGYSLGVAYDFEFGLGLGAGYESKSFDKDSTNMSVGFNENSDWFQAPISEKNDWAVGVSYTLDALYLSAMYNQSEYKLDSGKAKVRGYELAASYTIDAWTLLAGYNFAEGKADSAVGTSNLGAGTLDTGYEDLVDHTILGVQYHFTPLFKTYAEYKIQGLSGDDDQWTAGLQYNF